jgi:hypothetical protein
MNIEENDKLLAKFLGFKKLSNYFYNSQDILYYIEQDTEWFSEDLKFHKDWNLLMLVVEKIESFGHDVFINTCVCRITDVGLDIFEDIECFVSDNKIQATYNACVEFVQWYNNKNNEL